METEIVVAIIAGCATVLAAVIAGVFTLIAKKSKGKGKGKKRRRLRIADHGTDSKHPT